VNNKKNEPSGEKLDLNRKNPAERVPPSRRGKAPVNGWISQDLAQWAKDMAETKERTVQSLIEEGMELVRAQANHDKNVIPLIIFKERELEVEVITPRGVAVTHAELR